jgi:hypothetical protein
MKILMVGGVADTKAIKLTKLIVDGCAKRGVKADVVFMNVFTGNLKATEEAEKPEVIVVAGTNTLETQLPVVKGLALVYPYMGIEKVYDEIVKYNK